jgi:predicted metal-binding protein
VRVFICNTCGLGAAGFDRVLQAALEREGIAADIVGVECMSGCARPSTVAFRAPDKTAYLFGDLTEQDLGSLVQFAKLYVGSPSGDFADARPLGALRHKAIARIPGSLS